MSGRRWWTVAALVALAALLAVFTAPLVRSRLAGRETASDSEAGSSQENQAVASAAKGSGGSTSSATSNSTPAAGAPSEKPAPRPETPEEKERKAKIARAMDLSSIRSLIVTLKTSTLDDNTAIRSSTLLALKRYGATARPLLQEEIDGSKDERIRRTLEEALVSAQ